jgi:hypothetical protein
LKTFRANTYAPTEETGALTLDPAAVGDGVARVTLRVRVLRSIDKDTVERVNNSLRNLPDADKSGVDLDRLVVGKPR